MTRPQLPPAEPVTLVPLADIAKGGMGSVQLARAEGGGLGGAVVAVKRLHPNIAQDPQFVGMFLDEAWMTAALRSPNVVQVMAWGEDKAGMYLAVELVQGISLSRLIKEARARRAIFDERAVAFIGSQICAGLAAAHALTNEAGKPLGLVHRDLTPGNVLMGFDGVVKIADFGIAKAEQRITHTMTGTLKGKPAYMAPEQARGGKVDARADIFSFGVMFFEMLAGRRPWLAKGTFEVMMEIASTPAPPLSSLRGGLSPVFLEIVERCLGKQPDERFSSAFEIQARLDQWRMENGYVAGDLAALSSFVRRNATRQIAWFEQALRGDFARGGAPTFKDIEDKLDESRRDTGPSAIARPAAGAQAALLRQASGAPPTPPSGRSLPAPPSRRPPPPSPSARGAATSTPPPAPPPGDPLNRTIAVDERDLEVIGLAGPRPSLPPIANERVPGRFEGTELMQTVALPDLGAPPAPPPPGAPPPPSHQGLAYGHAGMPFHLGHGPGGPAPASAPPPPPHAYPGYFAPPGPIPLQAPKQTRSSRGLILGLCVLLVVVSAAAFAASRYSERRIAPPAPSTSPR